jgi:SAM-dependent methyltransferase
VLEINPKNIIAKENLEKLDSRKIEGWHFSMLGDLSRNDGYYEVIQRKVKKGNTVLDIGTGSGLLSMMIAKAGAQKVYTCETIVAIADAAKNVIKDNGYEEQVEIFNRKSNRLRIGEEIPDKVDVIVSEILDLGLLGEGVLPSIRDAKAHLLKEGGTIIPSGAQVKGVLIQSDHLKKIDPIKEISGFDLSSFGKFQVDHSYRQAILKSVPNVKLSSIFDVLPIDFYNLPALAAFDNPNLHHLDIEIKADGELHGVVFWFNLYLDEQLSLSSGPDGEMIHWGQAVCCFAESRKVKVGKVVSIQAEQSETKVVFTLM